MAITLNAVSLPDPATEEIEYFIRGTSYQLADGTINQEYISVTTKRRWSLSWQAVTASQRDDIVTACLSCLSGSRAYVDMESDNYTVIGLLGKTPPKVTTVNAVVNRYNITFQFEEV